MKKVLAKLRGKKQPQEPVGRITTDTLAEHREQVLAGGRKFKYPVQYQRHKLVINATIISAAALVLLIGLGWYLLYVAQNTSEFMYRVTKVVPVPVAVVDGEQVRYSDYLMKYRGTAHYSIEVEQIDERSQDGKRRLAYYKQQAMSDAVADAYAAKLARQLDISVSDAEVEAFLKHQQEKKGVSEASYNVILRDYYDWSIDEYKAAMKSKLVRQKVAYAMDTTADKLSKDIAATITAGNTDLKAIAEGLNAAKAQTVTFMPAAWVSRDNDDGGLAEAAAKLQKGQVSVAVKPTSGDGYYYVKLVDTSGDQIQYEYIKVPLTEFKTQLDTTMSSSKLAKFIKIEDISLEATDTSTPNQQ